MTAATRTHSHTLAHTRSHGHRNRAAETGSGGAEEPDPGRAESGVRHDAAAGGAEPGAGGPHPDARAPHSARPPRQDLRHALGHRLELKESGVRLAGRQTHRVGLVHH